MPQFRVSKGSLSVVYVVDTARQATDLFCRDNLLGVVYSFYGDTQHLQGGIYTQWIASTHRKGTIKIELII